MQEKRLDIYLDRELWLERCGQRCTFAWEPQCIVGIFRTSERRYRHVWNALCTLELLNLVTRLGLLEIKPWSCRRIG